MRLMRCLGAVRGFVKREAGTIAKFLLVGGASFLVYIAAYAFQSRILFPGAPERARVVMNFGSICLSVLFNYVAHRFWTYGQPEASVRQIAWYTFVVVTVSFLQTLLFWLGHVVIGAYDFLAIASASAVCACYSFFMHRFFTFKRREAGDVL